MGTKAARCLGDTQEEYIQCAMRVRIGRESEGRQELWLVVR